jgi:hypothetical protein
MVVDGLPKVLLLPNRKSLKDFLKFWQLCQELSTSRVAAFLQNLNSSTITLNFTNSTLTSISFGAA